MELKTGIIVKLQLEGLHCWPEVENHPELSEVFFLKDLHRHVFHIEARKEVNHDDRDVEIIQFKHEIDEYLWNRYYDHHKRCLLFKSMSCEMIAREIMEKFDCVYVSVLEDGENGGYIEAVK